MSAGATRHEILIGAIARRLGSARHVAVGNASPVPGSAALLAGALSDGALRVSILGSAHRNYFTDGAHELFDAAGQGRIDVFFLGGGQIDGRGNVNLVGTGGYPRPRVRFPGSFGSAYLAFTVPRIILFREEHSPRVLVPKVDFVSAPGTSPANQYRRGGPEALITGLCVFAFDRSRARFTLGSVHPGVSVADVRAATGFDFDCPAQVPPTAPPSASELALLRGPVRAEIDRVYPRFAARAFGAEAA